MAPNSLIFLVILGVWAAYLGKYWMRRRDHLATARSMDRFSESIRVLRESPSIGSVDLGRSVHRMQSTSSGGGVRPQVLVKRAAPVEPVATAPVVSPAPTRRRVPRPVRGILLLAALAGFVLSVPLGIFWDRFPAWGIAVLAANVVAAFLFLREAVQADLAARRATVRRSAPVRRTQAPAPRAAATRRTPPAEAVAEPEPVIEEPAAPAAPVVAEDDIPDTWDPRPVPRPTYAMKQRAEHPQPEPAATTPVPTPIELDDDLPADFGRVASGA